MAETGVWRLLNTGAGPGDWNMALDAFLLKSAELPTLRVYTWSGPTISLGYHQDTSGWLDLDRCRREGVDVVRRPTGGRAVFHHHELTYSLTAPVDHPLMGGSLSASWESVSRGLIEALRCLDLEAGIAAETDKATAAGKSQVCFASSRRFEIMMGGRKLVGSAQRRQGDRFLQQGSVRLRYDQGRLGDFMLDMEPEPDAPDNFELTPLGEKLDDSVDLNRFADALRGGFSSLFGIELPDASLSREELSHVERLVPAHRIP